MRDSLFFGAVITAAALGLFACGGESGSTATTTTGTGASGGTGGADSGGASTTGGTGGSGAATSASSGGTAGSGGSGATGGATGNDLAGLSDEFDDAQTLSDWKILDKELGTTAPYDSLDINLTVPGKLTVVPTVSSWYQDLMATFVYKEVTGDFVVEVAAAAFKKGTANGAPTAVFNSAGLLLRDPASVVGQQNWLMYNIGYQQDFIGVEGKATVGSQSELHLIPTSGNFTGLLRLCRTGNTVHMLRRLPGDADWTETHTFPQSFPVTPAFTLPATLQVGMIDNAYQVADVRAEIDHIRFARVTAQGDCFAELD